MTQGAKDITQSLALSEPSSLSDYLLHTNLLNLLPAAVYICSMDGTIQQYNEQAVRLWGRKPALGDNEERFCGAFRLYHPDGTFLPHDQTPVADCLRDGGSYTDVEVIIVRPDNSRVHVKVNVVPIFDKEGTQLGMINCFHDITAVKELMNRQAQSEQHVRSMLEALPAAVYTCNADGLITFYNEAAARLWGREPEIGKDMWCGSWQILKPDGSSLPLDECPMAICLREGRPVLGEEIIVRSPDGSVRNVRPHPEPFLDKHGKVTGAINMLLDITEIKKSEEALKISERNLRDLNLHLENKVEEKTRDLVEKNRQIKKSEERYHKMVAEVEDYAILLMDREGFILDWNKGAEKIKGYSAEEIIGKNFRLFYLQEDRVKELPEQLLAEAISKGKAVHEGWRVRKNGTKFWGSIVITALHNEDNEIIGFSKVTRDLSDRKASEEKIHKYTAELERQNQELEHFAYAASHDMKEPLRKIRFYGSTLSDNMGESLEEKNKVYLSRMIEAAKRMQKLIDDILAYSGSGSSNASLEEVQLSQIVDEVISDFKELVQQHNVKITVANLPSISGIRHQLRQLFDNIVGNAIRYRHHERDLHININCESVDYIDDHSTPSIKEANNYWRLSIMDNGLGFDPKYSETIFEIFHRLHAKQTSGSGIGLAICKKIVQNHSGIIKAVGEPEKGARFEIYLPMQNRQP